MQQNTQVMGSIRDEALYLVSIGVPIIPLCSPTHRGMGEVHRQRCNSPGKTPLLKDWPKWSSTTKENVIDWFREANKTHANINIGVPLGAPSGMIGIDIDGQEGEIILLAISNNDVPNTWEYTTGNGRRLLYRLPKGITTKKAKITGKGTHEGFEILCDGQQTVLPPSVHTNGSTYKWKQGHSPRHIPVADCPEWILEKIDASKIDEKEKVAPKVVEADWHRILHEGDRNVGITRLAGSSIAKGNSKEDTLKAAMEYDQNFCNPPLGEKEITTIIESIYLREQLTQSKKQPSSGAKRGKPQLRPTRFIQNFLNRQLEEGYTWKYSTETGIFFRFEENVGPWKMIDLDYVKSTIRKVLLDPKYGGTIKWDSQREVNECIEAMKALLADSSEENLFDIGETIKKNTWKHNPLDIICLDNGIYNWREEQLLPWTNEIYTTLKLPVKFDNKADYPNWKKALYEWLPDKETVAFLQEFIGLCLIPDTSYRTAVFLYGTGANGKSMFLDAIRLLFGHGLTNIPLVRLTEKFETAYLYNKLVNICGDIDATYISEVGVIKASITGDVLRGHYKFGKSFDFTPITRFMFSANQLPPVADKTHAWYSRWKYIKFPKTFEVNPTYRIEHNMIFEKEKSGILNWAIEGLIRLKKNNKFTESQPMKDSALEYRSENDNVVAFLEDYVDKVTYGGTQEDLIPTAVLYNCYTSWLETTMSGTYKVSQKIFSKRVQSYGFEKTHRVLNGKSKNVFLGMRPKIQYEKEYKTFLALT